MKTIILVAILLLSIFTVTMVPALQQLLQTPKAMLNKPLLELGLALCGTSAKSTEPGSGGGGQGVI